MSRICVKSVIALSVLCCCLGGGEVATAGISPENVIVVINAASEDSRTLANHYVSLRNIPSRNVIRLDDVPDKRRIKLTEFTDKILKPLLAQVDARGLAAQARVIAYSCDFPTEVGTKPHTDRLKDANLRKIQKPVGSLTALTFFYQSVLADNEGYLGLFANRYFRGPFENHFANPFVDPTERESFDEAEMLREAGQFATAADRYEQLFGDHPTLAPLAILAAECRAEDGDAAAAKLLVIDAVRAGWRSKRYLEESPATGELKDDSAIEAILKRLSDEPQICQSPIGFRGTVGWSVNGYPVERTVGPSYLLSCMLGYTGPNGSSMDQAVDALTVAAGADRTHPDAEFWYTKTGDPRTKARFPAMADAMIYLGHYGYEFDIVRGKLPAKPGRCAGLMIGTAKFSLAATKWKFVPGAIADNLTSLGAAFRSPAQTRATEFLHNGVAMTSGTVHEPFAVPMKFPAPIMLGFYATGSTAIESFYQSIASPYQQLILGDPLASAFDRSPTDSVAISRGEDGEDGEDGEVIRIKRTVIATDETSYPTVAMELYVNGRMIQRVKPLSTVQIKTEGLPRGALDFSLVLIGNHPIRPRVSHTESIRLGASAALPTIKRDGDVIRFTCENAQKLRLQYHGEVLAEADTDQHEWKIDPARVGRGPVRLRCNATVDGKAVFGEAVEIEVNPITS